MFTRFSSACAVKLNYLFCFSKISVGDYETITMLPEDNPEAPQIMVQDNTALESDYAEIGFDGTATPAPTQPLPAGRDRNAATATEYADHGETCKQQQDPEVEADYGYAAVEVRKSCSAGQAIVQVAHDTREPVPTTPSAQSATPQPCVPEEEYEYAKVAVRAARVSPQPAPACSSLPRTEAEGSEEDSYVYATVMPKIILTPVSSLENAGDSPRAAGDGASDDHSDDPSDEDDVYVNISQAAELSPIPAFPHPLGPDDEEPLAALREFLSNNRKVCRCSFFDQTAVEDPVGDMKRLLHELQLSA